MIEENAAVDIQHPARCPNCGRDDRTTHEDLGLSRFERFICHACWASWDVAHFLLMEAK